jgi:NAD(P)-dependent dehydrogenase (short-subunit alcohol dehydrogenase family)/acyl carrier protein
MQQSRHIGKVVIELAFPAAELQPLPARAPAIHFDPDTTYVVTGGLTGFGLESACWLAEHGAGHIVLLGRRGRETPGAIAAIARIEALGARVRVFACDVADRDALATVFARMDRELPRLGGVLHAAMVLDDAPLTKLDDARFRKVLAPKVEGAWNLHELTFPRSLDHFIVYSSVTTVLGSPGQGNYVAANAYLEALVAWRRARGLPGTCVAWGPIGDVGVLARDADLRRDLTARLGGAALDSRQALATLERLLADNRSQVAVADIDWNVLSRVLPSAEGSRFELLRRAGEEGAQRDEPIKDIRAALAGKSPDEVRQFVQALVTTEVAHILAIGQERLDPSRSLQELGMDSLMAVELAMGLEKQFDIRLPAMVLGDGPSIERLSVRLAEMLSGTLQPAEAETLESLVSRMDAQHQSGLTADELADTVAQVKRQSHG